MITQSDPVHNNDQSEDDDDKLLSILERSGMAFMTAFGAHIQPVASTNSDIAYDEWSGINSEDREPLQSSTPERELPVVHTVRVPTGEPREKGPRPSKNAFMVNDICNALCWS